MKQFCSIRMTALPPIPPLIPCSCYLSSPVAILLRLVAILLRLENKLLRVECRRLLWIPRQNHITTTQAHTLLSTILRSPHGVLNLELNQKFKMVLNANTYYKIGNGIL